MATTPRQETAQIFQFPVRSRQVAAAARLQAPQKGCDAWPSQPVVMSDFGSGWYHEAAMEQAEQTQKH